MNNNITDKSIHGAFALLGALISSYLGIVAVPILILCVVMIIDYITGMIAAWKSKSLSSKKGAFGIVKKICYLFLVCVGIGVDWLIYSGLQSMGVSLGISMFFGVLVTIWLIINELISILENLKKIGVPLPSFLSAIVNRLKHTTENVAEGEKNDEKGN